MRLSVNQVLFWTPRVLTLLFAVFVSLFALDVFGEHYGFWRTILALFMHLVPTAIILVILAISWRWELVGALSFVALGAYYVLTTWGRMHWSSYLVIAGPLFLVGAMFLIDWMYRARLATK